MGEVAGSAAGNVGSNIFLDIPSALCYIPSRLFHRGLAHDGVRGGKVGAALLLGQRLMVLTGQSLDTGLLVLCNVHKATGSAVNLSPVNTGWAA